MNKITKNICERITSVDAAIAELGEDDNEVVRLRKLQTIFDDPTDHLLNYQTAVVLVRAINEKREPNWNDPDEWKYTAWFHMGGSSGFRYDVCDGWGSASGVGSRLCLFDPDHGEYLAKTFTEVFKNFMLIIPTKQN
jgi:hypothetical protein